MATEKWIIVAISVIEIVNESAYSIAVVAWNRNEPITEANSRSIEHNKMKFRTLNEWLQSEFGG